jgi:hypothetical protein
MTLNTQTKTNGHQETHLLEVDLAQTLKTL